MQEARAVSQSLNQPSLDQPVRRRLDAGGVLAGGRRSLVRCDDSVLRRLFELPASAQRGARHAARQRIPLPLRFECTASEG
jgi:hypothetical protein